MSRTRITNSVDASLWDPGTTRHVVYNNARQAKLLIEAVWLFEVPTGWSVQDVVAYRRDGVLELGTTTLMSARDYSIGYPDMIGENHHEIHVPALDLTPWGGDIPEMRVEIVRARARHTTRAYGDIRRRLWL